MLKDEIIDVDSLPLPATCTKEDKAIMRKIESGIRSALYATCYGSSNWYGFQELAFNPEGWFSAENDKIRNAETYFTKYSTESDGNPFPLVISNNLRPDILNAIKWVYFRLETKRWPSHILKTPSDQLYDYSIEA